jgi:hypothetical protein
MEHALGEASINVVIDLRNLVSGMNCDGRALALLDPRKARHDVLKSPKLLGHEHHRGTRYRNLIFREFVA